MTVERKLHYDPATKLLKVEAIAKDEYNIESVRKIYADKKGEKETFTRNLENFEKALESLKKIESQPRMKEIVTAVLQFVPNAQLPDKKGIESTIKYYKDNLNQIEKDMNELEEAVKEIDECEKKTLVITSEKAENDSRD